MFTQNTIKWNNLQNIKGLGDSRHISIFNEKIDRRMFTDTLFCPIQIGIYTLQRRNIEITNFLNNFKNSSRNITNGSF